MALCLGWSLGRTPGAGIREPLTRWPDGAGPGVKYTPLPARQQGLVGHREDWVYSECDKKPLEGFVQAVNMTWLQYVSDDWLLTES